MMLRHLFPFAWFPLLNVALAMIGLVGLTLAPLRAVAQHAAITLQSPGANVDSNDFAARQTALDQLGAQIEYDYQAAQHDCYDRFFVNYCLSKARKKMRAAKAKWRIEQLALDGERRAARALARDQQIALQRAQEQAQAPQRAAAERANRQAYQAKQQQFEREQIKRSEQAPQRAANQREYDRKQADYQRKLAQARAQAAQAAERHAQNIRKYQKKQEAATRHAQQVEARRRRSSPAAPQSASDPAANFPMPSQRLNPPEAGP